MFNTKIDKTYRYNLIVTVSFHDNHLKYKNDFNDKFVCADQFYELNINKNKYKIQFKF